MSLCQEHNNHASPYREHQRGELQQASQWSQCESSRSWRAHSGGAHQRWEEAGQGQSQKEETAKEHIQKRAECEAGKGLHLNLVLHLKENISVKGRNNLLIIINYIIVTKVSRKICNEFDLGI